MYNYNSYERYKEYERLQIYERTLSGVIHEGWYGNGLCYALWKYAGIAYRTMSYMLPEFAAAEREYGLGNSSELWPISYEKRIDLLKSWIKSLSK